RLGAGEKKQWIRESRLRVPGHRRKRRGSRMSEGASGDANTSPVLETLDEAECLRLISPGGIGRIAFTGRYGLTVLPVNYKLHDGAIVCRTAQDSPTGEDLSTGIAHAEYQVAFEIDQINPAT